LNNPKARALHDLLCEMLRGPHIHALDVDTLASYIQQAGIALHNLPFFVDGSLDIQPLDLEAINKLDPGAEAGWGPWVSAFAATTGIELPAVGDQAPTAPG